jgi:hypothetical protein
MSRRSLLLLTLLALALRVAFLLVDPASGLAGDEPVWTVIGVKGILKLKHPFSPFDCRIIFYPPGYPYFIAALRGLFGSLRAVLWAQTFLGALLVPALGMLASKIAPRAGATAAVLAAVYPELLWFSAHYWSETLFLVFLWWGFERAIAARASGRMAPALVAGLLMGLASLTRETAFWFIPAMALWLLWGRWKTAVAPVAAFALSAGLIVGSWTARNWIAFHGFVPVATCGALNLWEGNTRLSRAQVYEEADAVPEPMEQYRQSWAKARAAILERQPLWIFEKLQSEMPLFWGAESEAAMHLERGAYGPNVPLGRAALVRRLLAVPYLAVLALALIGLVVLKPDPAWWLLLLFAAYYNALHVVSHAMDRYRLPILPLLFLLAGVGASAWRAGEWRLESGVRRGLALLAGMFWLLVAYWSLR